MASGYKIKREPPALKERTKEKKEDEDNDDDDDDDDDDDVDRRGPGRGSRVRDLITRSV